MPCEQHPRTSFVPRQLRQLRDKHLDSDVVEHMQAQHPLNTPTSMGDTGGNEAKQVGSLMESEDCATLAYISAAVDSLCGVARKHGHMVVSFESRGYKVVLGKSNAD